MQVSADRQAGARRMCPWLSVLAYTPVFPVWRARGSAGARRADAREGGRREAMGAVCGKGRCTGTAVVP